MVFYVSALVSLPLFLCLSFFCGFVFGVNSESFLCAVGFYVCVPLCVCSKEMTLPRGGESQEGNNVRQWVSSKVWFIVLGPCFHFQQENFFLVCGFTSYPQLSLKKRAENMCWNVYVPDGFLFGRRFNH